MALSFYIIIKEIENMNAPCLNCVDRNPPCHDSCERYKDFRMILDDTKKAEQKFNYGRSVIIESSLRQTLKRIK